MKNIGLLISSLNSGGAERVVSRLSYLLSDYYHIYVIIYEDTHQHYACNGTIINMGIKAKPGQHIAQLFLPLRRAWKLKHIKKTKSLDTVISFLDSPNIVNLLSRTQNCKTAVSIRNYEFNTKGKFMRILLKYLYQRADRVISVSQVIQQQLISECNIHPTKAYTIYNPFDVMQIKELSEENLEEGHDKFFQEGKIFISMGRQVYQKGFWHLIKAFKQVHDQYPEAKLVIVGRDESNGKAEKLAHALNLHNHILLTGNAINPFKYLARSHIYVLTSLYEGFPNALAEAMACGLPVIATDCKTGPREILYENPDLNEVTSQIVKADYGILVPPLSSEENWEPLHINESTHVLSEAMLMVARDDELCHYYIRKSEDRIKVFDYETCNQRFRAIVEGS